jgi:hypothetical protein
VIGQRLRSFSFFYDEIHLGRSHLLTPANLKQHYGRELQAAKQTVLNP